jgi:hypothetical protein
MLNDSLIHIDITGAFVIFAATLLWADVYTRKLGRL